MITSIRLLPALTVVSFLTLGSSFADSLERNFANPPLDARPWVYWFWINGNISSNGVTADLEAMKRVGIGGVLIMEVDQGVPVGPVDFAGTRWREIFKHVHAEARRLGLQVNMNNDAGWNGSGGPWIKPEQSMQEVTWTETNVAGPAHFDGTLPQPDTVAGFYREIAVQAFPSVGEYRIQNIGTKAAYKKEIKLGPASTNTPCENIAPNSITNLTSRLAPNGRLTWDVPSGSWTIIRFGHTSTGVENAPAPKTGRGLECDKLSKEGIEANFAGLIAKLAADNGLKDEPAKLGMVATHIDSWENGSQNWTAKMPEEFQRRRGYDLIPFLPVFTGRVVGSLEISERFLWDLRQTVSELVIENYAGHMRELAHAHGLRFTVEAYGSPCDSSPYAGQSDEPMGEFWTPSGAIETCKAMASAGHIYGKQIVGAESFTSADLEKWREHPATLKPYGDHAFCEGINRFVFHRYAFQPWAEPRRPGMTMGPWGQHYERTQTWWEWSPAWHQYLARCQFLLRQGLFVADICYVQPEAPPQGPGDHPREGYAWDECTAPAVLNRMSVKDGRVVLPDGMGYSLLVLPNSITMTPQLLHKVQQLVEAGAIVLGPKPLSSPSLSGYPACDDDVKQVANALWGQCDGQQVRENRCGKGRIVWGDSPEKFLQTSGVQPDFTSGQPLRFIHRRTGDTDLYFVANPQPYECTTSCGFRIGNKVPEFWWPDSGRIERAAIWESKDGLTRVSVPFEPNGSVFVVFRQRPAGDDPVVLVKRDGQRILAAAPDLPLKIRVIKARYGVLAEPSRTRDVAEQLQGKINAGQYNFDPRSLAEKGDPAPNEVKSLTADYTIEGKPFTVQARDGEHIHFAADAIHATVEKARYGVLDDPARTRDMRQRLQQLVDSGQSSFKVADMAAGDDPAVGIVKTLELDITIEGELRHFRGTDPEPIHLANPIIPPKPFLAVHELARNKVRLETRNPGAYEYVTASGRSRHLTISSGCDSVELSGPWQVRFAPGAGAPAQATFDNLISWSQHSDPGIKYFSGEATYSRIFTIGPVAATRAGETTLPRELLGKHKRLWLDLGNVQIMARVKLNGKELGLLWKPPFRLDITHVARTGNNQLEVQVVNLWPNRMIGDQQLPDDSDRNPEGTLKSWPQWLLEGKPSPTGRLTFTTWRLWKKDDALFPSGLLGPVTLSSLESIVAP